MRFFAIMLAAALAAGATPACAQSDAKRGEYLAKAAGCMACHTEERKGASPYAGGRALKTPFGIFYSPNITPDPQAGIGRWSETDFVRAMREGVAPDGENLYPAFPYTSFTYIRDRDLRDLWAYLKTLPPSPQKNRPHDLPLWLRWRWLITPWKWLFFTPGPWRDDPRLTPVLNRGAYLVRALGHCGECHTPRNFLGAMRGDRFLAGGIDPDGKKVPNLTPTKLKKWSDSELKDFLTTGIYPDGDVAAEAMAEVVKDTTSQLAPEDLSALIAYLRSLPPLPQQP